MAAMGQAASGRNATGRRLINPFAIPTTMALGDNRIDHTMSLFAKSQ